MAQIAVGGEVRNVRDVFYEIAAARLKDGTATANDRFYLWLHTRQAQEFFAVGDITVDIAIKYGLVNLIKRCWRHDGASACAGGFAGALAGMCFEIVGALRGGDSDLLSRAGMLQGLESLCAVGGWTLADYVGVAFPLAVRCLKSGVAELRQFDPMKHEAMGRLIGELDKFDFHKNVKVADSVGWHVNMCECEISRLEEMAIADGVKLYYSSLVLNIICHEIGNVLIDWLKVADIQNRYALVKFRETVTGDESARAEFLKPFKYNKRLESVDFVGGRLWGDLLDVARFESSRAGAAHGDAGTAGHDTGTDDSLLNDNAARFVSEYKSGVSFRCVFDDCPDGVTVNIHHDLSNANIGRVEKLLLEGCYTDGWCRMPDDWKRPSAYKTDAERIFFTHVESKRDIETEGYVEGNAHLFRLSPVEVKRRRGGSNKGARGVGAGRGNKKQ